MRFLLTLLAISFTLQAHAKSYDCYAIRMLAANGDALQDTRMNGHVAHFVLMPDSRTRKVEIKSYFSYENQFDQRVTVSRSREVATPFNYVSERDEILSCGYALGMDYEEAKLYDPFWKTDITLRAGTQQIELGDPKSTALQLTLFTPSTIYNTAPKPFMMKMDVRFLFTRGIPDGLRPNFKEWHRVYQMECTPTP